MEPATGYTLPAKVFHWLTALAVLLAVPMGIAMTRIDGGPLQNQLFDLHRSFGATILALTGVRLLWRLFHPAPPPVAGLPSWQGVAARAIHYALYLLLFAVPLIGWIGTSAYGAPIVVFGLFELPALVPKDRALADLLLPIHGRLAIALTALFLLHGAAALHHHFVRKDATLSRMLGG